MTTTYKTQAVGPVDVFYREAGPADAPVLLLLHGYPTSSHMFRYLIPQLATAYHVIAPDLPGFGLTSAPPRGQFCYTFESLASVLDNFTQALGLQRYALYIFDYGAPTGLRLATAHPERVTAIISQNGNAYEEGLSSAWAPYRAYWASGSPEARDACRAALTTESVKAQYFSGADELSVSPDGYMLDLAYLSRRELMKSNSTSSTTTATMSRSIQNGRPTCTLLSLRCWLCGVKTTASFCLQARKPSRVMFRMQKSRSTTRGTSPLKHMGRRLALLSSTF